MTELEKIIEKLKKLNTIVFGPFTGEYGWEIIRWSGFVRWYKKHNPNKNIIVSTRYSSCDLYYNCLDQFHFFDLIGDNDKVIPECYCGLKGKFKEDIIKKINNKFSNVDYILDPSGYAYERNIFPVSVANMDFNFQPRERNKIEIENILNENSKDKKIITMVPRYRTEIESISVRNWKKEYWQQLYRDLDNTNKVFVLIVGKDHTYVRPDKPLNNVFCVEDCITNNNKHNVSHVGLTIEAIKHSCFTIGSQSGNIILSNLLKVPTLFWGNEIKRHSLDENIFRTKSIGIEDTTYSINPTKIFNKIKETIEI